MYKKIIIILTIVILLTIPHPIVSASYYKKLDFEVMEKEWDFNLSKPFNTISSNNQEKIVITFEDNGWWLEKKGITFTIDKDKLTYSTGWSFWKKEGTIKQVKFGNALEETIEAMYDNYGMWHIRLFGEYNLTFFYIDYIDEWDDWDEEVDTWDLGNMNLTIYMTFLYFGSGDKCVGCIYETNSEVHIVKDMIKERSL